MNNDDLLDAPSLCLRLDPVPMQLKVSPAMKIALKREADARSTNVQHLIRQILADSLGLPVPGDGRALRWQGVTR